MEIPLFQDDTPLRFERIVLYPYPDLKRIWTRLWLPAIQDKAPNVEIAVLTPTAARIPASGMMARSEQRIETTCTCATRRPAQPTHRRRTD